jgi:transposase
MEPGSIPSKIIAIMPKLNSDVRKRAQNELRNGAKPSEVAAKYGISNSACSYLKAQATGTNPGVSVFESEFNKEQRDRFALLLAGGESINDLAKDYETSAAVLKSYIAKYNLPTGVIAKLPTRKKIKVTPRGNGKRK